MTGVYMMTTKEIVQKWYDALPFPDAYDDEFTALLKKTAIEDAAIGNDSFSAEIQEGDKNLFKCLYFCEALSRRYAEQEIADRILYDTLSDLVFWTNIHVGLTGSLGLSEVNWVKNHLSMKLFRLGRLQYCFGSCGHDIDALGVKQGDSIIEVHIPGGEPLDIVACKRSVDDARRFFAQYFPQVDYKCFTCGSWLLDDTLINFMQETANIIRFQRMFTLVTRKESDAILKYSLGWNARKENLHEFTPANAFTERVMKHVADGGVFYSGFGYIQK